MIDTVSRLGTEKEHLGFIAKDAWKVLKYYPQLSYIRIINQEGLLPLISDWVVLLNTQCCKGIYRNDRK